MTTSALDSATRRVSLVSSNTSPTTGDAPICARRGARSAERVRAVTLWPASTRSGTRNRPIAPLPPAMKTFTAGGRRSAPVLERHFVVLDGRKRIVEVVQQLAPFLIFGRAAEA